MKSPELQDWEDFNPSHPNRKYKQDRYQLPADNSAPRYWAAGSLAAADTRTAYS
jgi:hypothetical protein